MKYKMNRNEATKFLQDCVAKCYKHEMSWSEYKAIEIEYIPLDLSEYPAITTETAKWINFLFTEETTDRKGNYMLRGFTPYPITELEVLSLHYGDYSRNLNFWAFNDEEQLLYTYCEGDTTLTPYATEREYKKAKAETLRWYKEEF